MTDTPKKILIVDDNTGIKESLKPILSDNYDLIIIESIEMCEEVLSNSKDIGIVIAENIAPIREKFPELKTLGIKNKSEVEEPYLERPFRSDLVLKSVEI